MAGLTRVETIKTLFEIGAIKFGEFTLKTGLKSPIYFDLRVIISFPKLMAHVSELLWEVAMLGHSEYSYVCGVPYTALPLATCISTVHDIPMLIRRKEAKDYGTKKMIEGIFEEGGKCLIVEDVVTSGGSVLETARSLKEVSLKVTDAVVLLNREQGGLEKLQDNGIKLHCVFTVSEVLQVLEKQEKITAATVLSVQQFIKSNFCYVREESASKPENTAGDQKLSTLPLKRLTYTEREEFSSNPLCARLWKIMAAKETNLAFSVDVTSCKKVLELADAVGPYICILKTHADILADFSEGFVKELATLAKKHNFLIFEDRKFADIGNTVKHQYSGGIYKILEWADIITVHAIPGEGIINGLEEAAIGHQGKGCVLIAQMSSKGNLASPAYTERNMEIAAKHKGFVMGFVCQSALNAGPGFVYLTPGVHLKKGDDNLGQQYNTPEAVVGNGRSDIIIVGRGIYEAVNPVAVAKEYKEAGYNAFLQSLKSS